MNKVKEYLQKLPADNSSALLDLVAATDEVGLDAVPAKAGRQVYYNEVRQLR